MSEWNRFYDCFPTEGVLIELDHDEYPGQYKFCEKENAVYINKYIPEGLKSIFNDDYELMRIYVASGGELDCMQWRYVNKRY